jgi:hypothetical protein
MRHSLARSVAAPPPQQAAGKQSSVSGWLWADFSPRIRSGRAKHSAEVPARRVFDQRVRRSAIVADHTFLTNSDFNPIAPIPSILQSMS